MSLAFSGATTYKRMAMLPALIGAGFLVFGFLINRQQFFVSYLQGYLFAVAFPLGCLSLILIHNLTGGKWGWTIRPFLEAGMRTIPAMAILFLPIVVGMTTIYPWTNHELVAHDAALQAKAIYLNEKGWMFRALGYFVSWSILAWWLRRWLLPGPGGGTIQQLHRVQRLSAGGLILYALTASFAAIDWVMSVEPHWFSSIFSAIFMVGCAMSAFAISTVSLIWLNRTTPNPWLTDKNLHDLGKFLFMTVMLWGYMSLSQFLIIWSGNLPEETFWYYQRSQGWWWVFSTVMPLMQWALPFCFLLAAGTKKNQKWVVKVALFLMVGRALEQIWLVSPSFNPTGFPIHWMDVAAPVALGGLCMALYFAYLGKTSGVPAPAGHQHHEPQDKPHGAKH